MTTKTFIVKNETGLHSRPADLFVRTAKLFRAKITVSKDEKDADAKNIVRVILLNVQAGNSIEISADGVDEAEALDALTGLVESNFTNVDSRIEI